jgi:hypothetical protein
MGQRMAAAEQVVQPEAQQQDPDKQVPRRLRLGIGGAAAAQQPENQRREQSQQRRPASQQRERVE